MFIQCYVIPMLGNNWIYLSEDIYLYAEISLVFNIKLENKKLLNEIEKKIKNSDFKIINCNDKNLFLNIYKKEEIKFKIEIIDN